MPGAGWARRVLLPLLLLALSWQGYLVGAHVHRPIGGVAATLHNAPTHERRAPPAPDSCPICEQISVAAVYLPAPPVTFATPALVLVWYGVSTTLGQRRAPTSHAWRSRGPPAVPAAPF